MATTPLARGLNSARPAILLATTGLSALLVAACSSGGSSGATSGGTASGGSTSSGTGGATVATRAVSGMGDVLVDAKGRTLYASDQEGAGKLLCTTSDCTAIWSPVTIAAGKTPSGPAQLSGKLSVVTRPDGASQVTLNGKPLYTFSFDHAPGDVAGNGQKDSFGGTNFTWHVATASGSGPAPAATSSPPSGNYGY